MLRSISIIILSFGAICNADAQQAPYIEITPGAGFRAGGKFLFDGSDASYSVDDSSSFSLIVNAKHGANTQWEFIASRQNTSVSLEDGPVGQLASLDFDIETLQVGGTYLGETRTLQPYFVATIGGTRVKTPDESDTFWSGSIGVGLRVRPESRIGVRLEARAYGTLTQSDTDLFCRTGPDLNICAARIEGDMVIQVEAFAGIVFRF